MFAIRLRFFGKLSRRDGSHAADFLHRHVFPSPGVIELSEVVQEGLWRLNAANDMYPDSKSVGGLGGPLVNQRDRVVVSSATNDSILTRNRWGTLVARLSANEIVAPKG